MFKVTGFVRKMIFKEDFRFEKDTRQKEMKRHHCAVSFIPITPSF